MDTSPQARALIEGCFSSIGGVKSFISFTRLGPDQQRCIDVLREKSADIYAARGRDLHLSDLITAITGDEDEEADEPIGEGAFSQHRFYRTYAHDLRFYPEKFDFLLKCIENAVCVVKRPPAFERIIAKLTSKGLARRLPDAVVRYDELLAADEEARIESFTLRRDWVCRVPHYLDGLPPVPPSSSALLGLGASESPNPPVAAERA